MRKFLLIATLGALMASCAQEEIPHETINGTPLAVSSVSLANIVTKGAKLKDAVVSSTTFTTSSKMGVYLMKSTGYATPINNVEYDYVSSTSPWSPAATLGDPTKNIYLNNKPATVCAYYPLGASGITTLTEPKKVTLTPKAYTTGEDLCYAINQTGPKNTATSVSFPMNHAYAAITFTVTKDATYSGGTANIANIKISNSTIITSNTLDITSGDYATTGFSTGEVSFNPGISLISDNSSISSSVLMVPTATTTATATKNQTITTLTGDILLTFNVDGTDLTATLPAGSIASLIAGQNYKISVTLKGNILVVTGVTIASWTDVTIPGSLTIQ
ncbi:MAG: fimbrillin family protein [Bacteroidota bacterium]|nr:fimbrillin family protein [Bacteroidota bacterium]